MKKILKIIIVVCFGFMVLNVIPLLFYAAITGSNKIPFIWGASILGCFGLIMLCVFAWMWIERDAVKKEITEIINS